jgi:hypothetical protein
MIPARFFGHLDERVEFRRFKTRVIAIPALSKKT